MAYKDIEKRRAYDKKYYLEHKEEKAVYDKKYRESHREDRAIYNKKYREANSDKLASDRKCCREKITLEVFTHYSGGKPKCGCCGEERIEFLSIDHIEGEGAAHRRSLKITGGYRFYRWLKKEGYPPGYRVLCYNCNLARGFHGYCPHEKKKLVTVNFDEKPMLSIEDDLNELGMRCAKDLGCIEEASQELNNLF